MLGESSSKVSLHSLSGQSDEQVKNYIQENIGDSDKKVHKLFGNKAELEKINKLYRVRQQRVILFSYLDSSRK